MANTDGNADRSRMANRIISLHYTTRVQEGDYRNIQDAKDTGERSRACTSMHERARAIITLSLYGA